MIHVRVGAAPESDPQWEESLAFVRMASSAELESAEGWNRETARLLAIDTAMIVYRNNLARLVELDRQVISVGLNEARRLVSEGRDGELGHIQHRFESRLGHSWSDGVRGVWLTCLNALLPSPYRAAQATVECSFVTADCEGEHLAREIAAKLTSRMEAPRTGSTTDDRLVASA